MPPKAPESKAAKAAKALAGGKKGKKVRRRRRGRIDGRWEDLVMRDAGARWDGTRSTSARWGGVRWCMMWGKFMRRLRAVLDAGAPKDGCVGVGGVGDRAGPGARDLDGERLTTTTMCRSASAEVVQG